MDATAAFRALVSRPEPEIALDEGSLLIAAHAHPDLDVATRLAELDALALGLPTPDAPGLSAYLFGELGFAGNTLDYGDPRNSYLDDVLDRRLGIPISLAVLMIEVGRRRGIGLEGVAMPGHFLVGAGAGEWYDPFDRGTRLDVDGCAARFAATQVDLPFRVEYLAPVGPRVILNRMLANLQRAFLARDPASAAWAARLRLTIPGLGGRERGELAGMLGSLGRFREAAAELETLAAELPDADAARAAQAAARFRARTN